ncbi:pyridoxal phosphate-dependent aminotransferase [Microtetraspora malaysiensis]|uniref:pyridoxal phosphate-dependent aminotransferase n=1 Tax=Microtetraspora malaysiensis TaxID=161358 RepID=UPI003D8EEC98
MLTGAGSPAGRERSRDIPLSCLHEIHQLVGAHPRPVIALHVGEPYIRMPQEAVEGYCKALRDGHTAYTDARGLTALHRALAEQLAGNGQPPPERLFVTPGSCQAISAILQSLAVDGGQVVLPELHWPMHYQQVVMTGMRACFAPFGEPGRSVTEALEAAAGERTVAVLVNSPGNPSGRVWSEAELRELHAWAVRRRVPVISDEAYEDFVYDGQPCRIANLDLELPPEERVVFSVHTFSKGYSMTGCRLGYATAPNAERAMLLTRVQETTLVAPSTPVQYAGLAALGASAHLAEHHAYVRRTRDAVVDLLGDKLLHLTPDGGWYAVLDLGSYVKDTYQFCKRALADIDVGIAPGRGFLPEGHPGADRLARISLCAEREATLEGVRRLTDYLGG